MITDMVMEGDIVVPERRATFEIVFLTAKNI